MTNTAMAVKAGPPVAGEAVDGVRLCLATLYRMVVPAWHKGLSRWSTALGGDFTFNPSLNYMGLA